MLDNDNIVFGKEITFYTTVKEVSEKHNIRYTNKVIKTYKKMIMSSVIFNFELYSNRIRHLSHLLKALLKITSLLVNQSHLQTFRQMSYRKTERYVFTLKTLGITHKILLQK